MLKFLGMIVGNDRYTTMQWHNWVKNQGKTRGGKTFL